MISPNDTYTTYLDTSTPEADRLPEAQRPALVFRYGTVAQLRQLEDRLDALRSKYGRDYFAGLKAAIDGFLVESRNLQDPEGKPTDDITEVMTLPDLKALAYNIPVRSELTETDRKNSESPSPLVAAASAESAAPAAEDA